MVGDAGKLETRPDLTAVSGLLETNTDDKPAKLANEASRHHMAAGWQIYLTHLSPLALVAW